MLRSLLPSDFPRWASRKKALRVKENTRWELLVLFALCTVPRWDLYSGAWVHPPRPAPIRRRMGIQGVGTGNHFRARKRHTEVCRHSTVCEVSSITEKCIVRTRTTEHRSEVCSRVHLASD